MEILLITVPGPGVPADVVLLADEMAEDPRCHVVAAGADDGGAVLITIWDGDVTGEVAAGIRSLGLEADVRTLTMPEGLGRWR